MGRLFYFSGFFFFYSSRFSSRSKSSPSRRNRHRALPLPSGLGGGGLREDLGPQGLDPQLELVPVGAEDEVAVRKPRRGPEPDELEEVGDDGKGVDSGCDGREGHEGHERGGAQGDDGGLLVGALPGEGDPRRGLGRELGSVVGRRQLDLVEGDLRQLHLGEEVDLRELDVLEGAEAALLALGGSSGGAGLLEGADGEGRGAGSCREEEVEERDFCLKIELQVFALGRKVREKGAALSLFFFEFFQLSPSRSQVLPTRRAGAAVLKAAELSNGRE